MVVSGCALEVEKYVPLGDKVAHPSAITHDGERFYVVNSDMERVHNAGSILTLNQQGDKLGVISTPRLGRFIVARQPFLVVGYSPTNQYKTPAQLIIYDAREPKNLRVYKKFELSCSPISATVPRNYNYFSVSCDDGKLHVGYFTKSATADLPDIKLRLVRDYGPHARRAVHIDTKHHHLYAFSTDWQRSEFEDVIMADSLEYVTTPQEPEMQGPVDFKGVVSSRSAVPLYEVKRSNEIPDAWESLTQLTLEEQHEMWSQYQVAILDLRELAQNQFAFVDRYADQAQSEFRWLYFQPESSTVAVPKKHKYYRSNFWQVVADPQDSARFFISQRGVQGQAKNADVNSIYQVEIVGSPFAVEDTDEGEDSDDSTSDELDEMAAVDAADTPSHPQTVEFLKFSKAWGHGSQSSIYSRSLEDMLSVVGPHVNSKIRFTGNFELMEHNNSRLFLINDFRDPSLFDNNAYSLTLTGLKQGSPEDLMVFTNRSRSYFAIAAIDDIVLAGTFYTHTLSLFAVTQDNKLRFIKDIH